MFKEFNEFGGGSKKSSLFIEHLQSLISIDKEIYGKTYLRGTRDYGELVKSFNHHLDRLEEISNNFTSTEMKPLIVKAGYVEYENARDDFFSYRY